MSSTSNPCRSCSVEMSKAYASCNTCAGKGGKFDIYLNQEHQGVVEEHEYKVSDCESCGGSGRVQTYICTNKGCEQFVNTGNNNSWLWYILLLLLLSTLLLLLI